MGVRRAVHSQIHHTNLCEQVPTRSSQVKVKTFLSNTYKRHLGVQKTMSRRQKGYATFRNKLTEIFLALELYIAWQVR